MRLRDLEPGQWGRWTTEESPGRKAIVTYWEAGHGLTFKDDLGIPRCPPDMEAKVDLYIPRLLQEGERFYMHQSVNRGMPHERVIFYREDGWRFRVTCQDYNMAIPFRFMSTDSRVGWHPSVWLGHGGRMIRHLDKCSELRIEFANIPVLFYATPGGLSGSLPSTSLGIS